jgi:spermidine synthase
MDTKGNRKVLYLLFFITGISGLIYQVLWVRMFGLIFGNTIFASSTVLAAFMAGLALGSYWAGSYIARRSDGLRIYAMLELFIGVVGILMPVILGAISLVYVWLYRGFHPSFPVLTVIRFIFSFLVLLIPCTFMGATLPVLSKYITDHQKDQKEIIGKLYGLNTLGAVIGCFSSGFILIGKIGLTLTSLSAALLNLTVALTAYFLFTGKQQPEISPENHKETKRELKRAQTETLAVPANTQKLLLLTYALSGFAALALEIAWTRALVWITGVDSYAFATMLAVILAGIGIGSLIYSALAGKIKNALRFLYCIQFLIGMFVIISISAIQNSFEINRSIENAVNDFSVLHVIFKALGAYTVTHILVSSAIFLIPSILMGIAFPLFAAIFIKATGNVGRGIGNIYSANTTGGILGSILMGFLIVPVLGLLPSIALMGAVYFLISLILLAFHPAEKSGARWFKAAAIIAVAVVMVWVTDLNFTGFLKKTLRSEDLRADEKLVYYQEYASGGVMVKESEYYGTEMLIDGVQVASSGDHDLHSHLYPAHLISLLKKEINNALIIAFGAGGTSGSMLLYDNVKNLDVVEICEGVVEPARKYFTRMNKDVLRNPKLNLMIQDGKNYVHMTDKTYDVIYSGPIHPQSNQGSAALYTKDFFEDCKARLRHDGFQCLWLPMHMSSPDDFKIIIKTFMEVYPHVTLWYLPQTDMSVSHPHLIGSMEPIYPDYQLISERMRNPKIIEDLALLHDTSFKEPYEFIAQFGIGEENLQRMVAETTKLNTDNLPVVEFYDRPMNVFIASKISKTYLLADLARYMENPYPYVINVPDDKKAELKRQLDRLFEGNLNLVQGHCFLTSKNYLKLDVDTAVQNYYSKAYKLIPESTYLKKYFSEIM